jgi:hypothetical protein
MEIALGEASALSLGFQPAPREASLGFSKDPVDDDRIDGELMQGEEHKRSLRLPKYPLLKVGHQADRSRLRVCDRRAGPHHGKFKTSQDTGLQKALLQPLF